MNFMHVRHPKKIPGQPGFVEDSKGGPIFEPGAVTIAYFFNSEEHVLTTGLAFHSPERKGQFDRKKMAQIAKTRFLTAPLRFRPLADEGTESGAEPTPLMKGFLAARLVHLLYLSKPSWDFAPGYNAECPNRKMVVWSCGVLGPNMVAYEAVADGRRSGDGLEVPKPFSKVLAGLGASPAKERGRPKAIPQGWAFRVPPWVSSFLADV